MMYSLEQGLLGLEGLFYSSFQSKTASSEGNDDNISEWYSAGRNVFGSPCR